MAKRILKNVLVKGELTDIKIEDGKIISVGKCDEKGEDMHGLKAYPGLIDIHTHGGKGVDVNNDLHLEKLGEYQVSEGVTGWYPTSTTDSEETLIATTHKDLSKVLGALGFHMEGPYISKKYKGAQNEDYIKLPTMEDFSKYENVKLITLAPEVEGAFEFIEKCPAKAVIGHTDADYETALKAIRLGANCLTHTFNAMPPLHHRNPGVIGAAVEGDAYAQVICDGFHVHPAVVVALHRIFGKKMIVISDSLHMAYMEDGEYMFGSQKVYMKDGECRLSDGTIAGSSHSALYGVKKLISWGISEEDAFYAGSTAPAEYMGLNKGRIEKGFDADIILLDDELNLKQTIIGGKTEYVCRD